MATRESQLVDQHGNPIQVQIPETTFQQPQKINQWGTFGDLEPGGMIAALEQANNGSNESQAKLFRGMLESWPHAAGEWDKRKRGVSMTAWTVMEDKESENPAMQKKTVDVCKRQMRRLKARRFFSDAIDSVGYSVSMIEGQWTAIPNVGHYITAHQQVPFEALRTHWRTGLWEIWNQDTFTYEPMVAYRHLLMIAGRMSGHPLRGGLFRALIFWYLLSRTNLMALKLFLELYGVPYRFAYGDMRNASSGEIAQVTASLKKLGFDAYAVFDKSWNVQVQGLPVGNSQTLFMDINAMANAEASKLLVGQTLSAEPGTVGSRSLGEVQYNGVMADIWRDDCADLAEFIQESVFWPAIWYNISRDAVEELPVLHFYCDPPSDLQSLSVWLKNLLDAGVQGIPVEWIFEQFGIPQAEAGKATIIPASVQKVSPLLASDVQTRKEEDSFNQVVDVLSKLTAGTVMQDEAKHLEEMIGHAIRKGASIEHVQRELLDYARTSKGNPIFAEMVRRAVGLAKGVGRYDAQMRQQEEVRRLQ